MDQVFIEKGNKYIPLQRFDLKAAKASTAFGEVQNLGNSFEVRQHPVVQSINTRTISRPSTTTSDRSDLSKTPITINGPTTNVPDPSKVYRAPAISSGKVIRPNSSSIQRPSGTTVIRPNSSSIQRPSGTTVTRPNSSSIQRPSGTTITRPNSSSIQRPSDTTVISHFLSLDPSRLERYERLKKRKTIGQIIDALLYYKQYVLKPDYPMITDESNLTCDTKLTCIDGSICMIPNVELSPYNGNLFYYEDVISSEGKNTGYIGNVTLSYKFVSSDPTVRMLPVDIDSVKLNLKTNSETYAIEGFVNNEKRCITISLKNEAVKIAFCNLVSQIDEMKCDIDIYYKFSGYSVSQRPLKVYHQKLNVVEDHLQVTNNKKRITPRIMQLLERKIANKDNPLYVKSIFIVKTRKTLNYPQNEYQSFYKHLSEVISGNPFKLNDDFSEYQRINCLSAKFKDLVDVYKSLFTKNSFLLFPKRYYLARNAEMACIYSTCFLNEEGVTENEQEISKVRFSFDVAPVLSEFDLIELKIELYDNNLLDKGFSDEGRMSMIFDEVLFNFPNDIGAESSINGDDFINNGSMVKDGQFFNIICETEELRTASLFITDINSAYPRFFNIVSKYKDLHCSAVVELDINKTIGEFLDWQIFDDVVTITNTSYSPCIISEVMLFTNEGKCYLNDLCFSDSEYLESFQSIAINIKDLTDDPAFLKPEIMFFKYESIEDIKSEFLQSTDQITSYYRNITLDFSGIDKNVATMEINIKHVSTGNNYSFRKKRAQKDQMLNLMLITKNENEPITILEISRVYRDDDGKILLEDSFEWNYNDGALIDLSSITNKE